MGAVGGFASDSFTNVLKLTLGDERNVNLLKSLDEPKNIETLTKLFGFRVKDNVASLRNSGLVITIIRSNPSTLHEYYKRTVFGEKVVRELD